MVYFTVTYLVYVHTPQQDKNTYFNVMINYYKTWYMYIINNHAVRIIIHGIHSWKWNFEDNAVTRSLLTLELQCLFRSANSCTIKLKIQKIVLIIRVLKAIGQIVSLIVHGVVERNKRCGSYYENFFFRVYSAVMLILHGILFC